MTRVIAYVDGLNLYHGLKAKHGRKYHWLDLQRLATSLPQPGQQLVGVRYFTARIRNQPDSEQRQEDYPSALAACCPDLLVVEGRFQERVSVCFSCRVGRVVYEEKETDVNLALAITRDAVLDRFDTALLISADADLCPVVQSRRRSRRPNGSSRRSRRDGGRTPCVASPMRPSRSATSRSATPSYRPRSCLSRASRWSGRRTGDSPAIRHFGASDLV